MSQLMCTDEPLHILRQSAIDEDETDIAYYSKCALLSVEIRPEEIDLVICPCTVFDEAGGRMGMGAGFYDRYLPRCVNARIAAVAFEAQKADCVPMEAWDRPMDLVFTEKAVYCATRK